MADDLDDYLTRHPGDANQDGEPAVLKALTTGDPAWVTAAAWRFWSGVPAFAAA